MRGLKIARLVLIRMLSSALTGKRLSRSLIMPGAGLASITQATISLDDAVRVTPTVLSILLQPNHLPAQLGHRALSGVRKFHRKSPDALVEIW
jgi:hypothetical protein